MRLAQQSLGDLLRQVGRQFVETVMEAEVEQLGGSRSQPNAERGAYRWGTEAGFCIIDSQRVPLARPRVRSRDNRELALGSYELFQRGSLLSETVWQKIMHGLTMRNYKEVVQQFVEAYAVRALLDIGSSCSTKTVVRMRFSEAAGICTHDNWIFTLRGCIGSCAS